MSTSIVNWDEPEHRRVTVGPIDGTWTDLGTATGTQRLGLRRALVEPGMRTTPAHTHSGEEEIFYVLGGSGLSWQGGATYEVGAGDLLAHVVDGPAHTLIAGPDGLDVLVFGERAISDACFLPRANVAWVGSSWVKAGDSAHPFAQEAAVGELEMPEPSARPASIVRADDVAPIEVDKGESVFVSRDLGGAAGARRTALRRPELAPGKSGYPPHAHSGAEELFVVLAGSGVYLEQDAGARSWEPREHPLKEGDVVSVPAGTGVVHALRAGPEGLTYLAYGNRDGDDVIWYPRSQKIAFTGLRIVGRFERGDYWQGEE